MFSPRRPADAHVQELLARQRDASLTYTPVGGVLAGADFDLPSRHWTASLGPPDRFEAARHALQGWEQYDIGWMYVARPRPPIGVDEVLATVARTAGLWSVNCCRIVNVVDEPDRFGYSIGTLSHHLETGEELFLLSRTDGDCRFEIKSASGPNHPLVRLGWRYAERLLRQFAQDAMNRISRRLA